MNKKQWYALVVFAFLIGNLFIYLDLNGGWLPVGNIGNPCKVLERAYFEQYVEGEITLEEYGDKITRLEDKPLTKNDVVCVVRDLMFTPFIWLFQGLFFLFMILAWLETKRH